VAPSTPQSLGLSRRRTTPTDDQPQPQHSEAAAPTSLVGSLARERIRRRGEAGLEEEEEEGVPFWQRTWFLALLLVMAAASFALALLLYLGLDLPEAAPAQSYAADPESIVEVCGHSLRSSFGFVFVGDRVAGSMSRFGDWGEFCLIPSAISILLLVDWIDDAIVSSFRV
jgi:hypothetical protein